MRLDVVLVLAFLVCVTLTVINCHQINKAVARVYFDESIRNEIKKAMRD